MQNEINNVVDERKPAENISSDDKTGADKPKSIFNKGVIAKIKSIKHIEIIIAVIVIVVMVLAYTSFVGAKDKDVIISTDEVTLTEELQKILSTIKGVGDAKVLIVYNGGKQLEIASKTDKHTNTVTDEDGRVTTVVDETSTPVIVGGDKPLIIGEKRADIDGVVVVADGGGDVKIRVTVTRALSTLLKLDYNKIQVFEKK